MGRIVKSDITAGSLFYLPNTNLAANFYNFIITLELLIGVYELLKRELAEDAKLAIQAAESDAKED